MIALLNSFDTNLPLIFKKITPIYENFLNVIYPPVCVACNTEINSQMGLCANCWKNIHFITGAICQTCGAPVPGSASENNIKCDSCLNINAVWNFGRAAIVYTHVGRKIIMALKYGDRLDIVNFITHQMLKAGDKILYESDIIAPVPLHRLRLLRRKYNQSALISNKITKMTSITTIPDLLIRHKKTVIQKNMTFQQRLHNQSNAIKINHRYSKFIEGKTILIVDDVLTTGATLSACAHTCLNANAKKINVLVFARAIRSNKNRLYNKTKVSNQQ